MQEKGVLDSYSTAFGLVHGPCVVHVMAQPDREKPEAGHCMAHTRMSSDTAEKPPAFTSTR